jgi:hypothetical protein
VQDGFRNLGSEVVRGVAQPQRIDHQLAQDQIEGLGGDLVVPGIDQDGQSFGENHPQSEVTRELGQPGFTRCVEESEEDVVDGKPKPTIEPEVRGQESIVRRCEWSPLANPTNGDRSYSRGPRTG